MKKLLLFALLAISVCSEAQSWKGWNIGSWSQSDSALFWNPTAKKFERQLTPYASSTSDGLLSSANFNLFSAGGLYTPYIGTITQLRALTTVNSRTTYICKSAGQEGAFKYDSLDLSSSDNTGDILVTAGGKRLKRTFNGIAAVDWYITAGSDTTVAIQNAITSNYGKAITFTQGKTYLTSALVVTNSIDINIPLGTTIKSKLGANEVFLLQGAGKNITIRGEGTIDGNKDAGVMSSGIEGSVASSKGRVKIDGITIKNTGKFGIIFLDRDSLTISNCKISNTGYDGIWVIGDTKSNYHLRILHNTVDRSMAGTAPYGYCLAVRGRTPPIYADSSELSKSYARAGSYRDVEITGNVCKMPNNLIEGRNVNEVWASDLKYTNNTTVDGTLGVSFVTLGAVISNNVSRHASGVGYEISAKTASFTGNYNNGGGITLSTGADIHYSKDVSVSNFVSDSCYSRHINVENSEGVSITGGTLRKTASVEAIKSIDSRDLTVTGVNFVNCGSGLTLINTVGANISGCDFKNMSNWPIGLWSKDIACDKISIRGNTWFDAGNDGSNKDNFIVVVSSTIPLGKYITSTGNTNNINWLDLRNRLGDIITNVAPSSTYNLGKGSTWRDTLNAHLYIKDAVRWARIDSAGGGTTLSLDSTQRISLGKLQTNFPSKTVTATTYTLSDADFGYRIYFNNSSLVTVTLPTTGLRSNYWMEAYKLGTGNVKLATSGTYIGISDTIVTQKTSALLKLEASSTWVATGSLGTPTGGSGGGGGFSDPMTTAGDMIVRNASNITTRLPVGTPLQKLRVNTSGTAVEWAPDPDPISGLTPSRITIANSPTTITDDAALNWNPTSKGIGINTTAPNASIGIVLNKNSGDGTEVLNSNTGTGASAQNRLGNSTNIAEISKNGVNRSTYKNIKGNSLSFYNPAGDIGFLNEDGKIDFIAKGSNPQFTIDTSGDISVRDFIGTGTRMVVTDAFGKMDTQTIPSGGVGSVSNVSSATSDLTVTNPTTTPTLTVISAPKFTTGRTISTTGDVTYTSPTFDGTANVTAAATVVTATSSVAGKTKLYNSSGTNTDGAPTQAIVRASVDSLRDPSTLGSIYKKNSWTGITDFTANGTTPTVTSNKLVFSGGTNTLTKSLDLNGATCLDRWSKRAVFSFSAITSTSYGCGIGIKSTNGYVAQSIIAYIDATNGANKGTLYIGNSTSNAIASTAKLAFSAGDSIELILERDQFTYRAYLRNLSTTTNYVENNQICSIYKYTAGIGVNNTGKFAFFDIGGTWTLISTDINSSQQKNTIVADGDSKTHSGNVSSVGMRWADLLGQETGGISIHAGGGDRTNELLSRVTETAALAGTSKTVILSVGTNDLAFGKTTTQLNTDYAALVTAYQAAGLTVYHLLINDISAYNPSVLHTYILANYPADKIVDARVLRTSDIDADLIHPIDAGHEKIFKKIRNTNYFGSRQAIRLAYTPNALCFTGPNGQPTYSENLTVSNVIGGLANLNIGKYSTTTLPTNSSTVTLNYTNSGGSAVYGMFNGVNQMNFGINNSAGFSGAANATSGRQVSIDDPIALLRRFAIDQNGTTWVGHNSTTYSAKIDQSGNMDLGNGLGTATLNFNVATGAGIVHKLAGTALMSLNWNIGAVYGGTSGAGGRFMGLYDNVAGAWRWGFGPTGTMYIGAGSSSYGLSIAQNGDVLSNGSSHYFNTASPNMTVGNGTGTPIVNLNAASVGATEIGFYANSVKAFGFGLNHTGQYGGTASTASGRAMYFTDAITGLYRVGINAVGDLHVGNSNLSYSARFGPTGNNLVGTSALAALTITPQATPSGLANGNIWVDNSANHIYARINGASYQLDQQTGAGVGISTFTTTGSSGAATWTSGSGTLNIPNYTLAGLGGIPLAGSSVITGDLYAGGQSSWSTGINSSARINFQANGTTNAGLIIGQSPDAAKFARFVATGANVAEAEAKMDVNNAGGTKTFGLRSVDGLAYFTSTIATYTSDQTSLVNSTGDRAIADRGYNDARYHIQSGTNSNLVLTTAGNGIKIKEGTNATMGIATLSAGTVTVSTTKVTANSRIYLTTNGGTITNIGMQYVSARSSGTSFTITSMNILDASDVAWIIIEPN